MKKNLLIAAAFFALPFCLMAQDVKEEKIIKEEKEIKEEKKKDKKKETKEIIIRQNGDKDVKLNVEINGDDVTINGKPLSEFKDADITINKRKMTITDGKGQKYFFDYSPGPQGFNWNNDNYNENQFKYNEDMGKTWGFGGTSSNGAFLGVTTEEDEDGAKVTDVVKGSAAEKAGLKKGDIITKIAEDKISGPESLSDVVGAKKAKEEVKITYKRNGKENTVKTTLGLRKNSGTRSYSYSSPGGKARVFTLPRQAPLSNLEGLEGMEGSDGFGAIDMPAIAGMDAYTLFPKQKRIGLKLQDTEDGVGVKVINVEDSSTAAIAGLKTNDIITEIDEDKIDNTDDAREKLVPEEGKKSYKIKALREGKEMSFDVKIPRKLKTANF